MSADCTTINATFAAAVAAQPDRLYLDFDGDQYSYARTDMEVSRFARGLHALGISQGDRVASVLDNSASAIIAWYAVNRLGAIYVPINTAYQGDYLRHQLGDCGARVAICDPDYLDNVLAIAGDLPDLERILQTGESRAVAGAAKPVSTMSHHLQDQGDLPQVRIRVLVADRDPDAVAAQAGVEDLHQAALLLDGLEEQQDNQDEGERTD